MTINHQGQYMGLDMWSTQQEKTNNCRPRTYLQSVSNFTASQTIEYHKFGTLCDMNLELTDHNWTKPEQDEYDILIGSDGSVKANRGTFAWISSEHNSYKAGGGEINTGGTEIHSFRSESAAILSAMSHSWDPTKPNEKACLTTDNESAKDV